MSGSSSRPSFLQDVLASAGQAEISDLKARIADVTSTISQLKIRVNDYMKNMYVDFDPLMKRNTNFAEQAERLSREMDSLFDRIEVQTKHDLANSTAELRHLHDTLRENSLMLSISSDLIRIECALKKVESAGKEKRFLSAAEELILLEGHLKNASSDLQLLDIYKSLKEEYLQQWESFCHERVKSLSSYIIWEETDSLNDITRFSLKVRTDDFKTLEQVTQALHLVDMLRPWMHKLQTTLMRSALLPIMEFESSLSIVDDDTSSTLNVDIHHNSERPSCLITLSNLTKCFEFIHGELDITFKNGDSFLSLLGADIGNEFSDSLVKKSLKDTVPSTTAHDGFSEVLEKAEQLHMYLSDIGFLSEGNQGVLDFVRNVDVLCTNKACELYLSKAREIMKKDLQDMVKVGPQTPASPLGSKPTDVSTNVTLDTTLKQAFSNPEGQVVPNLFQFPQSCVSKSSLEILELVRHILSEAGSSPDHIGVSLLHTARSIFQLYMAVVPSYHEKFLGTIPQQIALFHNNCMYLAHNLLTLGFEFETQLHSQLKSSTPITFVDLVQSLRDLGINHFLKHMQCQRKQMLDVVKNSGLASLGENSNLSADSEKSVRQCLRQMELLKQVWHEVLPSNVYNKSIGILANAFIEELVVRVICVEDIPANTATELTSLFEMVLKRIPTLFSNEQEVVLHVKRWQKFQELIHVLGASLRDIEERWADGKGPLAQEFTMDQVKQLIRALFQNTKRRAEVLAKIR